jgi:ABC-type antimicrobial peptide transport system permease subunit
MALGARRASLVALVGRDVAVMTGIGLAVGVPAAMLVSRAASRVVDPMLFGTTALAPAAFAIAAALLAVVSVTAAILPARRAATVDPLTALRSD